jgi:hypothetical protein
MGYSLLFQGLPPGFASLGSAGFSAKEGPFQGVCQEHAKEEADTVRDHEKLRGIKSK